MKAKSHSSHYQQHHKQITLFGPFLNGFKVKFLKFYLHLKEGVVSPLLDCFTVFPVFFPEPNPSHHSTSTVFPQRGCFRSSADEGGHAERGEEMWKMEGECAAEMLAPWIIRQRGETDRQNGRQTESPADSHAHRKQQQQPAAIS